MEGGKTFFKRNSAKILIEFLKLKYFLKFRSHDRSGWVSVYLNGLGYQMSCGPLVGFQETGIHSRVHDGSKKVIRSHVDLSGLGRDT